MDANKSTVAANRLRSLKCLSLSASVGVDVSSASQQGTGSIVWLLPSLRNSYRVVERRERERPVIPSFLLLRIRPNVD